MTAKPSAGELAEQQPRFIPNPLWCSECDGRGYLVVDAEWEPHAVQCQACKDRRSASAQARADTVREALADAIAHRFPSLPYSQYTVADFILTFFAPRALAPPPSVPGEDAVREAALESLREQIRNFIAKSAECWMPCACLSNSQPGDCASIADAILALIEQPAEKKS